MFPSSGYFRGIPCPFYVNGLCERPYCHFRHSRVETADTSKSAPGNGPSYSTSTTLIYQSSTFGITNSSTTSLNAAITSTPLTSCANDSFGLSTSESVSDSLPIPSFSSSAPVLPESHAEHDVTPEKLPPISGLPVKSKKSLPSYVPTPKAAIEASQIDHTASGNTSTAPSYIPTPKSTYASVSGGSQNYREYDPVKNFAVHDKAKPSEDEQEVEEEEETGFSDDDDAEPVEASLDNKDDDDAEPVEASLDNKDDEKTASCDVPKTVCNGNAGGGDDDLTDSDEDVSWPAESEVPNDTPKDLSVNYADLLTPSSFFTEKLSSSGTSSSSCLNKSVNGDSSSQSAPVSTVARSSSTSSNSSSKYKQSNSSADAKHGHKSKSLERSNSTKNGSSIGKKSSFSSKTDTSNTELKSSSSSLHKSLHKSSSSSSSHKGLTKSLSSSESGSSKHRSTSSSSSSSSKHKSFSSSSSDLKHKSVSSSGSSTSKHTSSSSLKHSKNSSKHKSSESSRSNHKSSPSSNSSSSKHKSSSSSLSLNDHKSKEKTSLSSSNKDSSHSKRRDSNSIRKSTEDVSKVKVEKCPSSSSSTKNHSSSSEKENKHYEKSSKHVSRQNSSSEAKVKPEHRSNHHKDSNISKHKDKSVVKKESKSSSSSSSKDEKSVKKSDKTVSHVKKSPSSSNSNHHKSNSHLVNGAGNDFDSDIEIIEPEPPTVYNISDSDDAGEDVHRPAYDGGDGAASSPDRTYLDSEDEANMSDDGDTFDECLRIFQESERQLADQRRSSKSACPDKGKLQQESVSVESAENLLATVGRKRMAHANSNTVSRPHKAPTLSRPRLSPAQVMHNRIVDMQKKALLKAAKREGRENDLPQNVLGSSSSGSTGITVMGGGLPAQTNSRTTSQFRDISPSIIPPSVIGKQRVAHTPVATSLFPGHKTPPRTSSSSSSLKGSSTASGSSSGTQASKDSSFSMSPNSFYNKKKPSSLQSGGAQAKTVTIASTASKTEKRKAHEPTVSNLKRPLIPAEYGGKVPTNIRQRYLNYLIDEHLKFRSEEEAYIKGQEDEKAVYEKATNKNIYLGVAVNAVKRIRTEAAQALPSTSKRPCLNAGISSVGGTQRMAQSHAATLGGKNAVKHSYTVNRSKSGTGPIPDKIEGKDFYERLKKYIMSESELRENGFPRPAEDGSSKVHFYKVEESGVLLKDHERVCRRCGKRFNVTKEGDPINNGLCVYHYGSAYKKRVSGQIESRYGCCNERDGEQGCQVATYHVHEKNKLENRSGYMKTMPAPSSDKNYTVYSLDCEMVYTKAGLELARVTVVNEKCEAVYETLVKPDTDIIDYNTRFSGITANDMKGVSTTIRGVQAVMLSMISDQTILMGHSLESDLVALKLIHSTVVDTSLVFPHRLGPPYKRALRNLMMDHLQKIIQADDGGHDSKEDAAACMQLMKYKVKDDVKKEYRRN